ncbi:MAG: ATP-binding protein [Paludibacteraceae bacterium]|nr:ATP-binding protein [Paludibacteraceae bacterium]
MIRARSIRTRVLSWFVLALFIVLMLSALSFYFFMRNVLYSDAERLVRDKNFAVGGWINFDIKDINYQVNDYQQSQESAIFIQVTDLNRKVIGRTDNLKAPLPIPKALADSLYKLDNVVITRYQSPRYGAMLLANGTGVVDGRICGFVQVAMQEREITKTLDSVTRWISVSIPVLLLLSLLIGLFLTRKLIKPFAVISESAQRISIKELNESRLPVINPQDELGKLTIAINQLLDRLNEAVNSQQQFVADAAHELRTPLAIIQGEIEITLRMPHDIEEYRHTLNSNLEEVHRLSAITENLIALTRLDSSKRALEKEDLNLTEMVQLVIDRFLTVLHGRQITCSFSQTEPIYFIGNKACLQQLLMNLLDNAIKYSPDGSSVFITLQQDCDDVKISIIDEGIGIPSAEIPFIFNRFYRVDKSRSSQIKGSGLGLAIVKSIVDLHQGTIEVKSEDGKGTVVMVSLLKC